MFDIWYMLFVLPKNVEHFGQNKSAKAIRLVVHFHAPILIPFALSVESHAEVSNRITGASYHIRSIDLCNVRKSLFWGLRLVERF